MTAGVMDQCAASFSLFGGLRPSPAPRLLGSLRGEICDLVRIYVEYHLTTARVGVLDYELRGISVIDLLARQVRN
jgi:hypothetical protein